MARTEYAEITEGTRTYGTEVHAIRAGADWYIQRDGNLGRMPMAVARRDPKQPRTHEWVLTLHGDPARTFHPTLGTALSHAARLAAALLREEVVAEEVAALAAPPAREVTSTCPDCGQTVPTIATGLGEHGLPRCPGTRSQHMTGHRVPRDDLDRAQRLQEVQAGLATLAAIKVPQPPEVTPV